MEVKPSKDGIVRSVSLRMADGKLHDRDVTKIALIEAKEENETLQSKPEHGQNETASETIDVACRCTLEDSGDDVTNKNELWFQIRRATLQMLVGTTKLST